MAFIAAVPIIGDLVKGVVDIVDKMVPDKDLAAKMSQEITLKAMEHQQQLQTIQAEINKTEAAHSSIFVAGWRPAIGWVCAASLAWSFLGYDLARFILAAAKSTATVPQLASADYLLELVIAMLGLGAFRSFEKVRGMAR